MVPTLPGGPIAKRPLHFIFIADCSGSMAGDKIQSLNSAIAEAIPHMRSVAQTSPNAEILVRAVKFDDQAQWHVTAPTAVESFTWPPLSAGGLTAMGRALEIVADALKTPPMPDRALPPVLILISDGEPTDDFSSGLRALMAQPWGRKAVRLSIAIGSDADKGRLQHFIDGREGAGASERQPLEAKNAPDLVNYIKWASTVALRAASTPASQQQGAAPMSNVPLPAPPASSSGNSNDVW